MYRPAGIYLINLFPLSNWANRVYSMLKTPISRKAHTWFWRCRQWDGGEKEKGESTALPHMVQVEIKMEVHMQNRAPKVRLERNKIQGAGAYWLQNSHKQCLKPGIRDIHPQRQIGAEPHTGSQSALQSKSAV